MKEALFSEQTVGFTKAALEYCVLVENARSYPEAEFVDKASKLLPLLYLKILLVPELEEYYDSELETGVTEEKYQYVADGITQLLGENDLFLETFHPDMPYSDTAVAVSISENMADIYQDLGNFIAVFQLGNKETMNDALFVCLRNFNDYWGQKLVNVLRAVHHLRTNQASDGN